MLARRASRVATHLALALAYFGSVANAHRFQDRGSGIHANVLSYPAPPLVKLPESLPVVTRNGTELPPYNTTYYFDQLIDHNDPSLGTFKQQYWFTYEFYEPGGPIILYSPGEINGIDDVGFLTNRSLNGLLAQQENGATIVSEHRYYGNTNPHGDLSVSSLKHHTIQQAIDDLVYFAQNVKLPMPGGDRVTPDKAPWILTGSSYAGALTAWTMADKPGVFFAGYASSAPVQAITYFWQLFEPIRQYMPQNCSTDVQAIFAYVDEVFMNGSETEKQVLKYNWGLGAVTHLDDVAASLRNHIREWQQLTPLSGPGAGFFKFCDELEVKDGVVAGKEGWGLEHALPAWGRYWNDSYYASICRNLDAETCLGSYNVTQDYWTNTSVGFNERAWNWIICNEVGFFQDGPPEGMPAIVSRLVMPPYQQRWCKQMFPEAFSEYPNPRADETNKKYGGWDLTADRLFVVNGKRDGWRSASVSSDFRTTRESTDRMPIMLHDSHHAADMVTRSGEADSSIKAVQQAALDKMKEWLAEWKLKT